MATIQDCIARMRAASIAFTATGMRPESRTMAICWTTATSRGTEMKKYELCVVSKEYRYLVVETPRFTWKEKRDED